MEVAGTYWQAARPENSKVVIADATHGPPSSMSPARLELATLGYLPVCYETYALPTAPRRLPFTRMVIIGTTASQQALTNLAQKPCLKLHSDTRTRAQVRPVRAAYANRLHHIGCVQLGTIETRHVDRYRGFAPKLVVLVVYTAGQVGRVGGRCATCFTDPFFIIFPGASVVSRPVSVCVCIPCLTFRRSMCARLTVRHWSPAPIVCRPFLPLWGP